MNTTETLFRLFMELPPKLDDIERLLDSNKYTRECISEAFCQFAEKCFCEYRNFIDQYGRKPLDEEIHSTYVLPLCKLLLKYGLNPNFVFGEKHSESNIMYEVYWIDTPYIAADTLKILLENGGDPLLEVDGESIWHLSDFDMWFDVSHEYAEQENYKTQFDSRFHFWLVLRGFLFPNEEKFKEHSLYTYNVIQIDKNRWDIQALPKN